MDESDCIYLCMGSACHHLRGYQLLPVLERLIRKHGLEGRVALKGAFCLETCERGRSMKFRDRIFTDLAEDTLEALFEREILPLVKGAA